MKNFFTPTFLKFLTRFIIILIVGIVGVFVFGNLNKEAPQASTVQVGDDR